MWKKHIDQELIDFFMDRLFEECGYSVFIMEQELKEFGYSGKEILVNSEKYHTDHCETCEDVDQLERKISLVKANLQKAIDQKLKAMRLTEIVRVERDDFENLTKDLIDENLDLKKKLENSVLFSMGD